MTKKQIQALYTLTPMNGDASFHYPSKNKELYKIPLKIVCEKHMSFKINIVETNTGKFTIWHSLHKNITVVEYMLRQKVTINLLV